jgi:hypothetical protein
MDYGRTSAMRAGNIRKKKQEKGLCKIFYLIELKKWKKTKE